MANYNILMNRFNGTTHDTLLPKNHLEGTTDPTTSTKGIVGQFYLNITTKRLWQCTNVNGSVYTWGVLYPNKNLLDNAWFEAPYLVNQRGQSSYTATGYTVDRWKNDSNTEIKVESDHIRVVNTANNHATFQQLIDNPTQFAGKTLTLSAECKTISGAPPQLRIVVNETLAQGGYVDFPAVGQRKIIAVTVTLPEVLTSLWIDTVTSGLAATYDLYLFKLELGPISTLHLDTPPSPAEQELNRQVCQRYYQVIKAGTVLSGFAYSAIGANFNVPYQAEMRIVPTVTIASFVGSLLTTSGAIATADKITAISVNGNGASFKVSFNTSLNTYIPSMLQFNNPIILSADL